jgi:hypothetical protein
MDEIRKGRHSVRTWFKSLVSIFDALDAFVLAALLLLFSTAILSSPYVLAKELLESALVIPALVILGFSVVCAIAVGLAWFHQGLRWWYFIILIAISGVITEVGRTYFGL